MARGALSDGPVWRRWKLLGTEEEQTEQARCQASLSLASAPGTDVMQDAVCKTL
jgi:hypothetical protein